MTAQASASEAEAESSPPRAPRLDVVGAWVARLFFVAVVGALLEIALVIPVFPAAASDARGVVALFGDCTSLYLVFGAPFALIAAALQERVRHVPLPRASALLAAVLASLVAARAFGLIDGIAERSPAEFPEVIVGLQFIARATVVLLAAVGARLSPPVFDALLTRMPRLGEQRIVWAATLAIAAIASVAFAHLVLAPVYLDALAGACGLFFIVTGLFAAGLLVRTPSRRLVRASAVVCALVVLSIPFRFDDHARFVLFGHVPAAGRFAVWLRSVGDFDADSAGASWLYGTDCAPLDAARGPTLIEKPGDGIDQDCRGGDAKQRVAAVSPGDAWRGCVPPDRPSVLLVTIDAFRADELRPDVTPSLARLAASSILYTHAYAPAAMTGPSFASLFSGRSMTDLNTTNVLTDDEITIGETFTSRLRGAGYRTGGANVYAVHPTLRAAFDELEHARRDVVKAPVKTRLFAASLTDETLEFLHRPDPKPAFWWVHYPDAHAPYLEPVEGGPGEGSSRFLSPYERGLRHIDMQLARLHADLVRTNKLQSTIVVVTSDHGEQLGARAREGHGAYLFEEGIRVPLVVYAPGCPGRVVDEPVSTRRLGATITRLAGLTVPSWDGIGPTLLPGSEPNDLPIVSEEAPRTDVGFKRAIISGHVKLIVDVQNGGRMLFDLQDDPGETRNLARRRPDLTARLEGLYQRWLDATGARW